MRVKGILEGLDADQKKAASHFLGPALVVAGPGSGKTRLVVHRTAHLVEERGVEARAVLAVTFTNKAAEEMKTRLHALLGPKAKEVRTTTFHSLGLAILRSDPEHRGYRVLGEEEAEALMGEALKAVGVKVKGGTAKAYLAALSRARNSDLDLEVLPDLYPELKGLLEAIELYGLLKGERRVLDFDDLLHRSFHALRRDPELLAAWRARARFVLVDEYQDTNAAQHRLLKILLGPERNVMAVGDPNQAIYSWRGADLTLLLRFREEFPGAEVYTLGRNYRSHSGIVGAALDLFPKAALVALREGPPPVKVRAPDTRAEALFVAQAAKEMAARGVPYREMAVLVRSLRQTRELEGVLGREGVPYEVVGGFPFWKRAEVRFLLDLLAFGSREEAQVRLLASLVEGVGKAKAEALVRRGLSPILLTGFGKAGALLAQAMALSSLRGEALWREASRVLEEGDEVVRAFLLELAEGDLEEARQREENLEEALEALKVFLETEPNAGVEEFLGEVALTEGKEGGEGVRVMTAHRAKGMEFHAVFVLGLAEGTFPAFRSLDDPRALEEEARLAYVAFTRAKEELYLVYPSRKGTWTRKPSPFFSAVRGRELEYDPAVGYHGLGKTEALKALLGI